MTSVFWELKGFRKENSYLRYISIAPGLKEKVYEWISLKVKANEYYGLVLIWD